MDTPALQKGTDATVDLIPQLGMDGSNLVVVIIKQLYLVDRRDRLMPIDGAETRLADVPWDEDKPETSSTRLPSDVCIRKPGTDVILVGSAVGAYRPTVRSLDVMVRVGPVRKILRVFGLRVWHRGVGSVALSEPEPFVEQSLQWEFAYGGSDFSDPSRPLEEPFNPVGRGVTCDPDSLIHQPGPCIEDVRDLIVDRHSRPAPAGVGSIGPHWQPRRSFAGTADTLWMRERMPLRPADFDERHNQVATPELTTPVHLVGGEPVEMVNVSEDGPFSFALPRRSFFVGARRDDRMLHYPAALDTVLLQPGERTVELTWRSAIPLPRASRELHYIQVSDREIL